MLRQLAAWRGLCLQQETLLNFETMLLPLCGNSIGRTTLKKRYGDSFHRALINGKVLRAAIRTGERKHQDGALWSFGSDDLGEELTRMLANDEGYQAISDIDEQYKSSATTLLQRGVLFEADGYYCLPAECVMELREQQNPQHPDCWLSLTATTSLPMLMQIVPEQAQQQMLKPDASRNELAAWLAIHGKEAHQSALNHSLNDADWALLFTLQQHPISDFTTLHHLYPDLEPIEVSQHYYFQNRLEISLRKSLENNLPKQLIKLCRLGLIGITTHNGDNSYAALILSREGYTALAPGWKGVRQQMTDKLQAAWPAAPCDPEYISPWSLDQKIWQLWIISHFLPIGMTQQGALRKADAKKIATLLNEADLTLIDFLVASMVRGELLKQQGDQLTPAEINWRAWAKRQRASILHILRGWESWSDQDEKRAIKLLSTIPVDRWLHLGAVVDWLRARSEGKLVTAQWLPLFSSYQTCAMHHFNKSHDCIYLLPQFQQVLQQEPVSFTAPGWHGADKKKAPVHGYITAAGEIQLPPDCNHTILVKLASCCTLTSVEQMITLQLDQKAIQRMGPDKAQLQQTRALLESLQSPLPQPVAYLFERQQSQKPVAAVAATAMVVLLQDPSAIHRLRKTGFDFTQPFRDKPELLLLDASANAHDFIQRCSEEGILLDTVIKPIRWIRGTPSITAWMESHIDRSNRWLEICYQKARNSAAKQVIACIEEDNFSHIEVRAVRQSRQIYTWIKTTVTLEPRHILRLRELDASEISDLRLDQLL